MDKGMDKKFVLKSLFVTINKYNTNSIIGITITKNNTILHARSTFIRTIIGYLEYQSIYHLFVYMTCETIHYKNHTESYPLKVAPKKIFFN